MLRAKRKILTAVLAIIWLAVAGVAVALAILQRESLGLWTHITVGLAAFMLIAFVINFLPKKTQDA